MRALDRALRRADFGDGVAPERAIGQRLAAERLVVAENPARRIDRAGQGRQGNLDIQDLAEQGFAARTDDAGLASAVTAPITELARLRSAPIHRSMKSSSQTDLPK